MPPGKQFWRLIVKNKQQLQDDKISKLFRDPEKLTQIIQAGINIALLKHKQAGNPICESRNGKVVWIPPEKIVINEVKFDDYSN
jgi:hypothetical protein